MDYKMTYKMGLRVAADKRKKRYWIKQLTQTHGAGDSRSMSPVVAHRDISVQRGIERDRRIADIDERVVVCRNTMQPYLGGTNQTRS